MTASEAVSKGVINNETLAYFMTRTQMWLIKIGVHREKMRLRQHLKTEMAHYGIYNIYSTIIIIILYFLVRN